MTVYQLTNDCTIESNVYATKEALALRILDIVTKAKRGSTLRDLISVEELEVK